MRDGWVDYGSTVEARPGRHVAQRWGGRDQLCGTPKSKCGEARRRHTIGALRTRTAALPCPTPCLRPHFSTLRFRRPLSSRPSPSPRGLPCSCPSPIALSSSSRLLSSSTRYPLPAPRHLPLPQLRLPCNLAASCPSRCGEAVQTELHLTQPDERPIDHGAASRGCLLHGTLPLGILRHET